MVPKMVYGDIDLPKPRRHIKSRARNRCGVLEGSQHPASFCGPASTVSRVLRRRTTGCTSSSPLLELLLFEVSTMGLRSSRDIISTFCRPEWWRNDRKFELCDGNCFLWLLLLEFLLRRRWAVGWGGGAGLWPYCCCLSLDHTIISCCFCCCRWLSICAVLIIPTQRWWNNGMAGWGDVTVNLQ